MKQVNVIDNLHCHGYIYISWVGILVIYPILRICTYIYIYGHAISSMIPSPHQLVCWYGKCVVGQLQPHLGLIMISLDVETLQRCQCNCLQIISLWRIPMRFHKTYISRGLLFEYARKNQSSKSVRLGHGVHKLRRQRNEYYLMYNSSALVSFRIHLGNNIQVILGQGPIQVRQCKLRD